MGARCDRDRASWIDARNIQIPALRQFLARAADVFDVDQVILLNRALNAKRPLVDIGSLVVPVETERIQVRPKP